MIMEVDFDTSGMVDQETIDFEDTNDNSNFQGERCGICMDIIIDRGVLDCCQHWFCFGCIDNWATITNLCPLCQNEFQLITCVPVYDTIGNSKVDDDSSSRDDEWCVEGRNNTLSFPSYYIDENAVICLDGDGCKIRSGLANVEEECNLDTSIACDSCDIWYHAFCVGFDPEGTSEDTWLCPRCMVGEIPQKSDATVEQKPSNMCVPESGHTNSIPETTFSGKLSVSVADDGETAIVVSMIDGNNGNEEAIEKFHPALEVDKELKVVHDTLKAATPSYEKNNIPPILEGQGLELSLSHDTSFSQSSTSLLKISCADGAMNQPSSSDCVQNSLRKLLDESNAGNKLSESETSIGLHLGLSVGTFLSVDHTKNVGSEDQRTEDAQKKSLSGESSLRDEKLPDADKEVVKKIGMKRSHTDCSDGVHKAAADMEDGAKNEAAAFRKKIRTKGKSQVTRSRDQSNEFLADDSHGCTTQVAVLEDAKLKNSPEKGDKVPDIMSIVQGIGLRPSEEPVHQNPGDRSLKERENAAGLRVKKIMRRATEDESSTVVQKLRAEIREAVRNKSSAYIGENLFDPKLLAAFRTAVAGPTTEVVKKLPPSALKSKKLLLQKGKIRENLTKKIYGNSNGRRRRAWDRDCEVEFWKYRCTSSTKPEKIATLKSVLNLLRRNPEGSETEQASENQSTNPILSRLYLADTSVFPRKDDIKPLSALATANNSVQNIRQLISSEKVQNSSLDNHALTLTEANKVSSKLAVPSINDKGSKDKIPSSKAITTSSKAHLDKAPRGSLQTSLGGSKVISQKEGVQSDDRKTDKRKWALEVLARKKAATGTNSMHGKEEDNAILKGNYPLLAQLPIDMRPVLGPSRHNKIPIAVRQTQLYRLTEHFLRKVNLPEIRRTAETELAVADAINIEKAVADKSNSKLVYLNLCSQEIMHRSENNESIRAQESSPSPSLLQSIDQSQHASDELLTDDAVQDALRNAGLISDSPPSSPHHNKEVSNKVNSSEQDKEDGPENIFDIDSHPEEDIYGDFEYNIEDEDYIGATTMKAPKVQPEEAESRMKVVFSSLKSESLGDQDSEDHKSFVDIEGSQHSLPLLNGHTHSGIISSTIDYGNDKSCVPSQMLTTEEGEELSLAECEELYGPDKEPPSDKFPEETLRKLAEKNVHQRSLDGDNSFNLSHTSEDNQRKDNSKIDTNRQHDSINSISKKVEAYIKEHIRPLCKSGIISSEQYRWAAAKTTEKVMKYHQNAKNANFLIKEGEKVKKLAEQYLETVQQKEKK